MSSNSVFRLQERSSHHNLKRFEDPLPIIDKNEVLVKIRGISLNYRDIVIANGTYPFPVREGVIPCSDGAGEVIEVGSSVQGLKVGDHVIGIFDESNMYGPQLDWQHGRGGAVDGMLRNYIALPESTVVKITKHSKMTFLQAASLACTGTTAWNALYGNVPLKPGQTVLFQGTGGISITGLMLAKAAGATTIITSSSSAKLDLVKTKYGPDFVVNYKKTPNWGAEVNKITEGRGVDYILENGGSGTIKQSVECIAMGGIIAIVGFLSQAKQEKMPDVAGLALSKGCVIRGINVGSKQLLEELVRFVIQKELYPPVEKVFGFSTEEVIVAYDYLQGGTHIGKVCISLD